MKEDFSPPAHLGWRIAQSVTDDLLITLVAVALAAPAGILPDTASLRSLVQYRDAPLGLMRQLSALIPTMSALYVIYWVAKLTYFTCFLTWCNGQTPACRLLGLRVVMKDESRVTWRAAIGRTLAGGILAQTPLVGHVMRFADYAATFFNRRKQALRDMAVGTMLVHGRRRLPISPGGD